MSAFRRVAAMALCLALAGCQSVAPLVGQGSDKPEVEKVNVTYGPTSSSSAPLWLAADRGLFQKYGLTVELTQAASANGLSTLAGGQAQFFMGDPVPTFHAVVEGTPLKLIAVYQKYNGQILVVSPEIKSLADLKGKGIAISIPGDATDISARIALKPSGLAAGQDVTMLPTGTSTVRVAALLSGKVPAAVLSQPYAGQAVAKGYTALVDLTTSPFIAQSVAINSQWGAKNPKAVTAFLKGLIEGIKYFQTPENRAEVLATIGKYQKLDPNDPQVIDGYNQFATSGFDHDPTPEAAGADAILDGLKSLDPDRFKSMTADRVIDPSYMKNLSSAGFLKSLWGDNL